MIAIAALLMSAGLAGTTQPPVKDTIQFEFRKLFIQFLLVTALGAVLALLIDRVKHTLDRAEREREYTAQTVSSLLDQLDGAYRHVKLTRRLLRLAPDLGLADQEYKERLLALNDDQQDLEDLRNDIVAYASRIPSIELVLPHVKQMADYLGELWTEWERIERDPRGSVPLGSTTKLDAFLAHARTDPTADFHRFSEPYKNARFALIELLGNRLLGPPSSVVAGRADG